MNAAESAEAVLFLAIAGAAIAVFFACVVAGSLILPRFRFTRPIARPQVAASLIVLAVVAAIGGAAPLLMLGEVGLEYSMRSASTADTQACELPSHNRDTVTTFVAAPPANARLVTGAAGMSKAVLDVANRLPGLRPLWNTVYEKAKWLLSFETTSVFQIPLPREGASLATIGFQFSETAANEQDITPVASFGFSCRAGDGSPVDVRPFSPRYFKRGQFLEHMAFNIPEQCLAADKAEVTVRWETLEDHLNARVRAGVVSRDLSTNGDRYYLAPISGFSLKESFAKGETLELSLSAPDGVADLKIFRIGEGRELVHEASGVSAPARRISHLASREGVDWPATYSTMIPSNWMPGYYQFEMQSAGSTAWGYFLLRAAAQPRSRLAVVASTNTWQAYNRWGGQSFYGSDVGKCVGLRSSNKVSFRRPYAIGPTLDIRPNRLAHLVQAEVLIGAWLDRQGIDYDLYADRELHLDPELLEAYDAVVLTSHPEYWSRDMRRGLELYLDGSGTLIYLGGNGLYERVTISGDQMEGYNHRQYHEMDDDLGGFYYLLGQDQSAVLGVQYDAAGYLEFHPYAVEDAGHWTLAGTGLRNGDQFGFGTIAGEPIGASGHETDKRTGRSPDNTVLLAKGAGEGGAEMVYFDHPGGGFVYSVGSIAYSLTLNQDPLQGRILENVMTRALGRR